MYSVEFNTDAFSPALIRLASALSDMSPVMERIGQHMVKSAGENFKAGKTPDGTPWLPKSPATVASYKRRGEGDLYRPLFGATGALARGIFHQSDAESAFWGSNLIYAAVMQFGAAKRAFGKTSRGASIPWGGIPARPFIGVGEDDIPPIQRIIARALLKATEGSA